MQSEVTLQLLEVIGTITTPQEPFFSNNCEPFNAEVKSV